MLRSIDEHFLLDSWTIFVGRLFEDCVYLRAASISGYTVCAKTPKASTLCLVLL